MRRLTVLSVAYPFAPVGPDAVGGAEQVLGAIDRALVDAGHRSLVLAVAGSQPAGQLVAIAPPPGAIDAAAAAIQHRSVRDAMARVMASEPIDLVHLHGIDFHAYLPPPGPPALATLHLPLDWYPAAALAPARPHTWLHCVSASQARGVQGPGMLPPIPNGVATADFAVRRRRCSYLLMLARACPEKGLHLALEAAHAADVPLLIGGEIFPYAAHRAYFADQVRPLLDRRRRWLGPLGVARKRKLLAGARGVLIPSLAAETSSLVAMEAASAGTPAIAFRRGALPHTVEHGRTGFIVDGAAEMAAAIPRLGEIDPELCRAVARRRFDIGRMTGAYLARYAELAAARAA